MNDLNKMITDDFLERFLKISTEYIQEKRLKVSFDACEDYKQNEITSEAMNIQKFYDWMIELK